MLAYLQSLVDDLVRDDEGRVSPEQRFTALGLALLQYSKDRPLRRVEDVTSAGGPRLPMPAGALRVEAVEYPVGRVPPAILAATAWGHYHGPDQVDLLFTRPIAAGAAVRLTLLRMHVLTEDGTTIPATDHEALASYAAAVLFDQKAAATSGDGNPTIPADTVDHGSKPESYAKRAERLRQRYYDLLGIDVKRTQPASAMATQPLPASDGGRRMHWRRRR
ncbi:hypothetical protein GXW78_11920 [Roseomonas terrae]|uniref:Uncharacterized protein n=1 Tax=Neoroseomonas terrae TaxID=424799 RepID=A0ABS5EH66_9PROT|nr:hypothetical protein [Neoroseomonas terrae]MBR0650373.1 hypothetical protein [Neoroseomonas terrae]